MADSTEYLEFSLRFAIQSLPDKLVRVPSDWTVLQLKQHLYEDCPTKPEVDKQRLIYAGHCLKNEQFLREILNRNVGDGEAGLQVVHLVCLPSKDQAKANTPTGPSGLRNRQTPSAHSGASSSFIPAVAPTFADVPQDVNQAYAQAYHNHLQAYYARNAPQFGAGLQIPMPGGGTSQIMMMGIQNVNQQVPPPAAPAQNEMGNGEFEHAPDFLDLVYKLVRLVFLAAIVFYSSLDRIIFVMGVICLMWYVQMRRERDNRNGAQDAAAGNQAQANPPPADMDNNNGNDRNNNDIGQAAQTEPRISAWSVFWSTVSSFFSSLIPEPVPMNVN